MRPFLLVLVAASAWSCEAQNFPCTAVAAVGLSVTVTNAATGEPLCDASVTAVDGDYSERLVQSSCTFAGAVERAGTYVVRAEREGFSPKEVRDVKVVTVGSPCPHVQQVQLSIALSPE